MGITVCLAGATGLVGRALLAQLVAEPRIERVIAVTRRPLGADQIHAKVNNVVTDFAVMELRRDRLQADVFVSCLGTTIKVAGSQMAFRMVDYDYVLALGRIAEGVGANSFIVVSAIGADPNSAIFYSSVKGQMERDVRRLNIPRIEFVRPSLLLGEREERRPGEKLAQRLSPLLNPLLVGPLRKYRAVEADDVAREILGLIVSVP